MVLYDMTDWTIAAVHYQKLSS